MVWFFYNVLFLIGFTLLLPRFLIRMARRGGYASGFGQRFGWYAPEVRAALAARRRVWVHAVSVGEAFIALKLMDAWRARRPDVAFVRLATLPGMAERTLTIGSFAAVPGLAAWQVSWVAGGKEIFPPVRDLKQTITICTAAASQYAALAAVQGSDSDEDSYAVGQAALLALLKRHSVACHRPDSLAFVVAQGVDSARLTAACRSAGLLVRDGAALGNPGTVRIAVPLEERANALAALDRGLHAYKGA